MRRLFWLGLCVAVGVAAVRRVSRTAQAYTPQGLASSVSELAEAVREFGADVRAAMADRELELVEALRLDGGGPGPRPTAQTTPIRRDVR